MNFKLWHAIIIAIGLLMSAVTAQECPEPSPNSLGTCDEACTSNSNCTGGQLCCSNGCGHQCMSPVEDPCASIGCAAPNCSEGTVIITLEGQCCPVCAPSTNSTSATNQSTTPSVGPTDPTCPVGGQIRVECGSPCNTTCANMNMMLACTTVCVVNGCQCPHGMVIDEQSNTCVSPTVCPSTVQTCPTVQSTNEEDCVDECSSDDHCQYDRICCSNGCGGHTCSDSVEMCELIQCDWPICKDETQPVISPFSCCPYCPTNGSTDDNGGTGVTAIASVMTVVTCSLLNILLNNNYIAI